MLQSYEVKHYTDDGLVYVVVSLSDGSTFGQYIRPSSQAAMDAQAAAAAKRYEEQLAPVEMPAIGQVRTADAIAVELSVAKLDLSI
jgi:hypothetical protein